MKMPGIRTQISPLRVLAYALALLLIIMFSYPIWIMPYYWLKDQYLRRSPLGVTPGEVIDWYKAHAGEDPDLNPHLGKWVRWTGTLTDYTEGHHVDTTQIFVRFKEGFITCVSVNYERVLSDGVVVTMFGRIVGLSSDHVGLGDCVIEKIERPATRRATTNESVSR
jgi:hypothetical protein